MLNGLIKVDLHIHSKISEYKEKEKVLYDGNKKESIVYQSTKEHLDELLSKLDENHINMFSFSDHNRYDCDLYEAAYDILKNPDNKYKNINTLLSSVEFDVRIEDDKKPCHIITVFDAKTKEERENIKKAIDKDELKKEDESYSLTRFGSILRAINLDTIIIASQTKSLDNPSGGNKSVSNSVTDIYEFFEVGFIQALEYQKPNIEGILRENLKDFPKEMAFICGSDCHQWSAYPKHHENVEEKDSPYFIIKALPTFKGLHLALTSPKTRFRRRNDNKKVYKFINIRGEKIELSPSVNVIIGENGSGKSSIFSLFSKGKIAGKQKNLLEVNRVTLDDVELSVEAIEQNYIIKESEKSELFNDQYFDEVDNEAFEKSIRNYAELLKKSVQHNIQKRKTINDINSFVLKLEPEKYFDSTYYVGIDISDFNTENNIHKERVSNLNSILSKIKDEIDNNYYVTNQREKLMDAYVQINNIRKQIIKQYKEKEYNNYLINLIIDKVNNYKTKIDNISSTEDTTKRKYRAHISEFVSTIKNYYAESMLKENEFPLFKKNGSIGYSKRQDKGFIFTKKAKYFDDDNIENELLKYVFNQNYQSIEKLKSIETVEDFANSISSANITNYNDVFNNKIDKFINSKIEYSYIILDNTSNSQVGSTLGEQSLVYYKYKTNNVKGFDVLCIDQPEDNISNNKISTELITYFDKLRDDKQLIIVTHNPLLVVNLDADNVIYIEKKDMDLNIKSGCLESKGILQVVAEQMDGGSECIEKRLKFYNVTKKDKNNNR